MRGSINPMSKQVCVFIAFRAGTAESFSLMDFDEQKNFVGTPNFSIIKNIFQGNLKKNKKNFELSYIVSR